MSYYVLLIMDDSGQIQVDAYTPTDPEIRNAIAAKFTGALVDHFQDMAGSTPAPTNGVVEVPTSGVDSPTQALQQPPG